MVNYTETALDYKNSFDKNFNIFISFHKGANLNIVDFIEREKVEWQGIETILKDFELVKNGGFFSELEGKLFHQQFELNDAISEFGPDGEEFLKYKCTAILKFLDEKLESSDTKLKKSTPIINQKANEAYKEKLWFKAGCLFASGEIKNLLKKHDNNFTEIARQLNNNSLRVYLSESFFNNNTNRKNDKNIYNNQKKLQKIKKHFEDNNLEISEDFLKNIIPDDQMI
jgi:hypothetical protein